MQKKIKDFQLTDVVTMDTASLNELSLAAEEQKKMDERRRKAENDRKRVQTYFDRLPERIHVVEQEVFPEEQEIQQYLNTENDEELMKPSKFFMTERVVSDFEKEENNVMTPRQVVPTDTQLQQTSKMQGKITRVIQSRAQR